MKGLRVHEVSAKHPRLHHQRKGVRCARAMAAAVERASVSGTMQELRAAGKTALVPFICAGTLLIRQTSAVCLHMRASAAPHIAKTLLHAANRNQHSGRALLALCPFTLEFLGRFPWSNAWNASSAPN